MTVGLMVLSIMVRPLSKQEIAKSKIVHDRKIAMEYYKLGWHHGNVHTGTDSIAVDYCFKSDSIRVDSQFKTK